MRNDNFDTSQWIAVIGMSGRFPGARDVEQFWDNLVQGRDTIARLDREALLRAGVSPQLLDRPEYVPAAARLDDIDQFDAGFFGISPREAKELAPAMRLFLECAWEAFENAGHAPGARDASVGVFAGANMSNYWRLKSGALEPDLEEILGNDKDYLATHVSYKLNLTGPSISVQTACSTSLVAVHMACQALLGQQCDLALAGGGAVRIPHETGYLREEGSILSPDGRCRPFDATESGPVFGSGVGVVLLKRYDDAVRDGDAIRAVIRGSAVNNDGAGKVGFTAPSVDGQAAVIALAQALAGTPARSISYVEAHGTGTDLGDPIEIAALTRAFRLDTSDTGFCAIGSVKGNVGHLETAAGVTSLIKAVLALEHRELPPSLHFETPNPEIDFAGSPFAVNTTRRQWESEGPRRAGVSSFGMGGTNAHVVLEEAPVRLSRVHDGRPQLLALSARTTSALARMGRNIADHLRRFPDLALQDVAHTLGEGRARFAFRRAFVCASAVELTGLVNGTAVPTRAVAANPPRIGLAFGAGAVPVALAHGLYRDEADFRRAVAECVAAGAGPTVSAWFEANVAGEASDVRLAFTIRYALAALWRSWGVTPAAYEADGEGRAIAAALSGETILATALASLDQPSHGSARAQPGEADIWLSLDLAASPSDGIAPPAKLPRGSFPARRAMLAQLAQLWALGISPDWQAVIGGPQLRRVALPTYPFERQRYWVEERAWSAAPAVLHSARVYEKPPEALLPEPAPAPIDAESIRSRLQAIVGKALHIAPDKVETAREFMEMGADSLVLIESIQAIQKEYAVRLAVRDIFEALTTIDALAAHIVEALRTGGGRVAAAAQPAEVKRAPAVTAAKPSPGAVVSAPRWGVTDTEAEQLDERQQAHLAALVAAFNAKTAGSKRIAVENRAALADVRSTAGFKRFIKEMLYPIVVERGENARVVDVDGNDYIDVTMGFGVHLFGHKPPFLHTALADQLERDAPLGPENRDSGEAARLVKELTGCERVSFFNTGTEAVMTAIRLVRARSKRNRIALFKGSYHGHADPTLGIGLGDGQVVPLSGGIPADTLSHLLILDYGSEDALRMIAEHAHELAAVLVEPVQSRYPDRQPGEFLRSLRRVTAENDVALVFDEMITGFRIAAGGAQAWFGVEADVVTYGKVVGGGMPIGVIAGKAAWLDYLDGGDWRYGDDSAPRNETIFYAGTFNKNPWTMAAARATLTEIRRLGPSAYAELNLRTARLAATLNAFFESENLPMEVVHFASLFRFKARGKIDLFFFHMLMQGVYVWEGRNCFLSHAHTDEDVARIVSAVKASVLAMRDGGFIEAIAVPVRDSAPLTKAQSQLLMLGEIADDGLLAYNIHLTTSLSGRVDGAALELAVNALVRRHEALRTVFPQGSGRQEIMPPQWLSLGRMDLADYAEADREDAYDAWFAQENRHRFDLATGPLLRVTLIGLGSDEHRLIMTLPHIIGDGITLNILIEDLIAFYNAEREGRAFTLAPATPFRDYVAWLDGESAGPDFAAHEASWRGQLSEPLPVLGLPADHPRPAVKSFEAAVASMTLAPALADKLRRFSRGRSATLFMTCLAAWQLLLHRLSGDADVIVGVPTIGRAMEGAETLVGYCTHLLPIRSRLHDRTDFAAFLAQTRTTLLDAFEHQDYPFAALLEKLDLPHDQSRPQLLSATFNMDQPGELPPMGEAEVALIPPPVRYASYEMAMNVTDLAGALIVECKYHTSLYARERVAILLRQYEALLGQIVEDAERGVTDYDLANVVGEIALPDPAAPLPQPDYELPVTLLLRHAEATPDAIAIVDPARRWTYADLAGNATALARTLAARGVGPGDRVAVEGPRDGRLVCALVATWLAGAAFITLDDQLPAARRRVIARIGGAKLLVNLGASSSESAPEGLDVLDLGPDAPWPVQENAGIPLPPLSPDDPAYLFFTSGTTGVPKGILGLHKGVAHFVAWQRQRFEIGPQDRVAQLTALSFDALLREIFLPLSSGGALYIPGADELAEPVKLVAWLGREEITLLHTVPSKARNWLAASGSGPLPALRRVFFSGEPLTRSLVDDWRAAFGSEALLVNLYGSTETTMTKCFRVVEPAKTLECAQAAPLSAVHPMSDTQALVMSGDRLCGIGEPGEIVIRTPFRTAGYLDGGEAAAFRENPARKGDLIYRSGDQGRFRPDGSVEVMGRLDDQVKVRGVRVEPAEVKSLIDTHPEIANSAVVARALEADHELIAYVVPGATAGDGLVERLREFLAGALPFALVPRAIVSLDALPLLPNGKVDRQALPEPARAVDRIVVAPRNETESRLLAVWRDVLAVQTVGVEDNFFELGGNSLGATRVMSRIRTDFGLELPLKTLFTHPTVASLARHLDFLDTASGVLAEDEDSDAWEMVETL